MRILTLLLATQISLANADASLAALLHNFKNHAAIYMTFTQETKTASNTTSNVNSRQTGFIAIQRPSSFRFEYQSPQPYSIIGHNEEIFFYDPLLNQLVVQPNNSHALGPSALLTSSITNTTLQNTFSKIEKNQLSDNHTPDDHAIYTLIPESPDAQFRLLTIAFSVNGNLRWLAWQDIFNTEHILRIDSVKFNNTLPHTMFQPPNNNSIEVINLNNPPS